MHDQVPLASYLLYCGFCTSLGLLLHLLFVDTNCRSETSDVPVVLIECPSNESGRLLSWLLSLEATACVFARSLTSSFQRPTRALARPPDKINPRCTQLHSTPAATLGYIGLCAHNAGLILLSTRCFYRAVLVVLYAQTGIVLYCIKCPS